MKHNIDGKTFDEIFGQRGEGVKLEEMKAGGIYLCDQTESYGWIKLIKFDGKTDKYKTIDMLVSKYIYSDGVTWKHNKGFGMRSSRVRGFFTATPDQIKLLNSYLNESTSNEPERINNN